MKMPKPWPSLADTLNEPELRAAFRRLEMDLGPFRGCESVIAQFRVTEPSITGSTTSRLHPVVVDNPSRHLDELHGGRHD